MEQAGSHDTKSVVMRLVGIALMWVALAALVNVPSAADAVRSTAFAIVGFVSFAAGLSLFADGIKRELVAQLRRR